MVQKTENTAEVQYVEDVLVVQAVQTPLNIVKNDEDTAGTNHWKHRKRMINCRICLDVLTGSEREPKHSPCNKQRTSRSCYYQFLSLQYCCQRLEVIHSREESHSREQATCLCLAARSACICLCSSVGAATCSGSDIPPRAVLTKTSCAPGFVKSFTHQLNSSSSVLTKTRLMPHF